jgi:hypothetical protein
VRAARSARLTTKLVVADARSPNAHRLFELLTKTHRKATAGALATPWWPRRSPFYAPLTFNASRFRELKSA